MATLNSSNIVNGNVVETTDILQLYDAFTAGGGTTGVYNVSISGSLTGSATSASYALSASYTSTSDTSRLTTSASNITTAITSGGTHYLTFVDQSPGTRPPKIASLLEYDATTNNLNVSASYALTSSVSATASYALSGAGNGFPYTGSADITGSLNITGSTSITSTFTTSGSRVRKYRTITLSDGDYSLSPSPSIQSDDDIVLIIDNTTGVPSVGEGNLSITNFLNSSAGRCVEIVKVKDGTGDGIIILSATMAGNVLNLNNINESNGTRIICSSLGSSITLMSMGATATGSAWGNGY